jgi:hypothetical protein
MATSYSIIQRQGVGLIVLFFFFGVLAKAVPNQYCAVRMCLSKRFDLESDRVLIYAARPSIGQSTDHAHTPFQHFPVACPQTTFPGIHPYGLLWWRSGALLEWRVRPSMNYALNKGWVFFWMACRASSPLKKYLLRLCHLRRRGGPACRACSAAGKAASAVSGRTFLAPTKMALPCDGAFSTGCWAMQKKRLCASST